MPRRSCGVWSIEEVLLHNISDLLIGLSYVAIPIFLVRFIRRRPGVVFSGLFYLFAAFIVLCGSTHFMDIVMFYWPVYRFAGVVKLLTALASTATVVALFRIMPLAISMKTRKELEAAVKERTEEVHRIRSGTEKQLLSQIQHLNHLNQRKDEFMAMLGHELRNPLAAITNAHSLLSMSNLSAEAREMALDILKNQCEHMTRLTDDIIHVTRAIMGRLELRLEIVRVSDIIERAVQIAEPIIESMNHHLDVEIHCQGVQMVGDKIRLVQVVSNLLTNAAKYTPHGGSIKLTCVREENTLIISVTDNGIGIDKEDLVEIFDLCVRTERAVVKENGLGMGLTMAKAIVKQHDGEIAAHSDGPDTGSTFTVRISIKETIDESPFGGGSQAASPDDNDSAELFGS